MYYTNAIVHHKLMYTISPSLHKFRHDNENLNDECISYGSVDLKALLS